nr:MAG TPA: hypothetical protein [Caudoviricetes sp.]
MWRVCVDSKAGVLIRSPRDEAIRNEQERRPDKARLQGIRQSIRKIAGRN